MRCKMSNYTLLKAPLFNILNGELKTREESSQIRQNLYEFGQSSKDQEHIKETLSDFRYGLAQLIHFLTTDVMNYTRIGYLLVLTTLRQLCVHFASPLFTHSLPYHSIFTTI